MVPVVVCGCVGVCGVPGHSDPRNQRTRHHKGAGIEKKRANDHKIFPKGQNGTKARMASIR